MAATDASKGKPVVVVDDVQVIYKVFGTGKKARGVKDPQAKKTRMREVHAVKGVSFVVYEGETIGIVGSNGSGKSSLMRAIAGLFPATKGAVYTLGKPTMLGVGAALLPNLSGEKNIMLGGLALGFDKKEIAAASESIINFSGLKDFIDLPMRTYSQGMSARLRFSIAAAKKHDILIIDEALAVGDRQFRMKAEAKIREMRQEAGTVFLVSHNMKSIQDTCNRVIWLEKGELLMDGDPVQVCDAFVAAMDKGDSESMSNTFKSVTVMMPVRNEQAHLVAAVESVLSQNYPGPLEIVLALGPSIDQTDRVAKELAAKHPNLKLIENPKGLTTSGLNLAIASSSSDVIIRVDAHSELAEGYILRGVEILQESGSVLVGGVMSAVGKTALQKAVAFGYGSRFGLGGGSYHVGGKAGEAESAYLGVFDAKALKAVGGYDEKIIRGEDWDLAQRLKASGGKVWFSPELVVKYWPRSNIKALAWQFYSTGVWRGELTRRAPGQASIRYFLPPLALLMLVALVVLASLGIIGELELIIPVALYLLVLSFASATAKQLGILDRLAIFVALPVMHLSWAAGFWVGAIFGARKTVDAGDKK